MMLEDCVKLIASRRGILSLVAGGIKADDSSIIKILTVPVVEISFSDPCTTATP